MFGSLGSEAAFYEVAATLIPLFLLGGALFDRLKPGETTTSARVSFMAGLIPAVGGWVILAEAIAISAVVSGNSGWLTRIIVTSALSAGMLGAIVSLWWPWFTRYRTNASKTGITLYWCIAFGVVFCLTTLLMYEAIGSQGTEESTNATIEELNRVDEKLVATEDRIQALTVERARTEREFAVEMKPGVGCLGGRAFLVEQDDISRLLRREGDRLEALVIESIDLDRKLNGKPQNASSPFPAVPKFRPLARLFPLNECLREEERKLSR
jgi:hypothetical protein